MTPPPKKTSSGKAGPAPKGAGSKPGGGAKPPAAKPPSTLGIVGAVIAVVAVVGLGALFVLPRLSSGGGGGGAATSAPPSAPSLASCPTTQPPPLTAGETRTVTLTTDKGNIVIKVEGQLSPIAAGNFVALAQCGWYTNVVFHRLVPTFVIQGGDGQYGRVPNVDPQLVGTGGPPYTIQDEPVTTPYHRGTVAMARTQQPNSVGSQFFIVLDDQAAGALSAANTYQIIGEVTSGMDAVDAIAAMPNTGDPSNSAVNPVPMTKVTVATP
jgi:cyclophilin family peptidyl-prolyl cis-trans isomerase